MTLAQVAEKKENLELVRTPCQFGVVDTRKDYLAEFTQTGTILIERHPLLPPTFWEYAVIDGQEQLVFTSKLDVKEFGLDGAIDDYLGDGIRGRLDCLFTTNSKEIPAGTTLSCERNLWDNSARQLTFRRKIEGVSMSWQRVVGQDKEKEYFQVSFSNRSHDILHLRKLTSAEKEFMKTHHEFGLFLSSEFFYPAEDKSWSAETVVCYPIDSPWQLTPEKFYVSKAHDISFGRAPWQKFDGYHQRGDVFVACSIVDRKLPEREYSTKSIEYNMATVSNGSPRSLNWKVFESLFGFQQMGSIAGQLYGEYGALRTKAQKHRSPEL